MDTRNVVGSIGRELATILEVAPERVQPDVELASFNLWDSVTMVVFAAAMMELRGCQLNDAEINSCTTIGDLIGLVQRKTNSK